MRLGARRARQEHGVGEEVNGQDKAGRHEARPSPHVVGCIFTEALFYRQCASVDGQARQL
jgi:hypothetical protein